MVVKVLGFKSLHRVGKGVFPPTPSKDLKLLGAQFQPDIIGIGNHPYFSRSLCWVAMTSKVRRSSQLSLARPATVSFESNPAVWVYQILLPMCHFVTPFMPERLDADKA